MWNLRTVSGQCRWETIFNKKFADPAYYAFAYLDVLLLRENHFRSRCKTKFIKPFVYRLRAWSGDLCWATVGVTSVDTDHERRILDGGGKYLSRNLTI